MKITISLAPKKIALVLAGIALYLAVQSIILKKIEWDLGTESNYWFFNLVEIFNVGREANIPTWFSANLLLMSAVTLAIIAYAKKVNSDRYSLHWSGLSLVFLYLSIDEAAIIHETFTDPLRESLNAGGYLHFTWVIVGAAFTLIVGLIFFKFLLHLPRNTQRLFILAGMVYVGGALGVEAISANLWALNEGTSLTFSAVSTVEEFMEMLGVVVLMYAALSYLEGYVGEVVIVPGRKPIAASEETAEAEKVTG